MRVCPNCGSERLRLQMALFLDDAGELVCTRCGLHVERDLPAAIWMVIAAAPSFPRRRISTRPRNFKPKYRGVIDLLIKARQMRLPA